LKKVIDENGNGLKTRVHGRLHLNSALILFG